MLEGFLERLRSGEDGEQEEESQEEQTESTESRIRSRKKSTGRCLCFSRWTTVLTLCSLSPEKSRIGSSLMKDQGNYFLYVWERGTDREPFHMFCMIAMEYGTLYSAQKSRIQLLQKRAEILIKEDAVYKLREIAAI